MAYPWEKVNQGMVGPTALPREARRAGGSFPSQEITKGL